MKLEQKKLNLEIINFDLGLSWNSHWLINNLRSAVLPLVEKKLLESDFLFDPQDLEHQTLFYLTTYEPGKITQKIIEEALGQQYLIVKSRLLDSATSDELHYFFRGLKKFYPDLNIAYRLNLRWEKGKLYAVGEGRKFEVEFKKIKDEKKIALFTGAFHYVHQKRAKGDVFAFFFKGDRYPWAIETTEPSKNSREYKREALLAHGIHPDKAIELTRYYTLPGSPKNSISVIDKLVKEYYKKRGIEALFTSTMPAYSKTKSTTIAGGINKVLCVKDLQHYFIKRRVEGMICWESVTRRWIETSGYEGEIKMSHAAFNLSPVVDVYMPINKLSLNPIRNFEKSKEVIYFSKNKL